MYSKARAREQARRDACERVNDFTSQEDIYQEALDPSLLIRDRVNWEDGYSFQWWQEDSEEDMFLRSDYSVVGVVGDENVEQSVRYIALDALRFLREHWSSTRGYTWQDVRDAKPVLLVNPYADFNLSQEMLSSLGTVEPPNPLSALLSSFWYGVYPVIPPSWQSWNECFDGLSIDDKLTVLESLQPLVSHPNFPAKHLCVISGVDAACAQDSYDQVERFVKVVEKLFITSKKGKVLFVCCDDEYHSDIIDMLDDPGRGITLRPATLYSSATDYRSHSPDDYAALYGCCLCRED
ncbi:hypothetical protein F4804DRAFT_331311 [Jackrogersella minutella]|nr:hypothetical protein F4804DRAFT_331311 [Jackrogersella minutella]